MLCAVVRCRHCTVLLPCIPHFTYSEFTALFASHPSVHMFQLQFLFSHSTLSSIQESPAQLQWHYTVHEVLNAVPMRTRAFFVAIPCGLEKGHRMHLQGQSPSRQASKLSSESFSSFLVWHTLKSKLISSSEMSGPLEITWHYITKGSYLSTNQLSWVHFFLRS
jgi:hypothetical protein